MSAIYSKNECVNFLLNGVNLERVEIRQNAVVISYIEDGDELRRFVWVECKDFHLKDKLVEKAREIIELLKEQHHE